MSAEHSDIKIVVTASSGTGKTTMCGLISEILRAHGFDVDCKDEDIMNSGINILSDTFTTRVDELIGKSPKITVESQQLARRSPYTK